MAVLKCKKSVACYLRLKLTLYEWSSHGVELKLYLLSKCIPDCHKLSQNWLQMNRTHRWRNKWNQRMQLQWSQGFTCKEGEQTKGGKNEINLLNTFIELLTITKHNVWPLENKKQQMDQLWSWQILLQICDKGEIIPFLYSLQWYIYNVYLFTVCPLLFEFFLSKQKNHNLEISVLGQLCLGSPVTSTLRGS